MDYLISVFVNFLFYISIPIAIRYVILRKPIKSKWIAIGILVPIFIGFSILINIQRDETQRVISQAFNMPYKPRPHMLGSPILYIAMALSYGILRRGHKKLGTIQKESTADIRTKKSRHVTAWIFAVIGGLSVVIAIVVFTESPQPRTAEECKLKYQKEAKCKRASFIINSMCNLKYDKTSMQYNDKGELIEYWQMTGDNNIFNIYSPQAIDCILDSIGDAQNDVAASSILKACKDKYSAPEKPKTLTSDEFYKTDAPAKDENVKQTIKSSLGFDLPTVDISIEIEKKKHFEAIKQAHPDFNQIVDGGELEQWIDKQPSSLKDYYRKVYEQGTAEQVINMVSEFKKYHSEKSRLEKQKYMNQGFIDQGNGILTNNLKLLPPSGSMVDIVNLNSKPMLISITLIGDENYISCLSADKQIFLPFSLQTARFACPDNSQMSYLKKIVSYRVSPR